jgi:hypothetical protein
MGHVGREPFNWSQSAWSPRGAQPSRLSTPGSLRTPQQPDYAARPSSRKRALNLPDRTVRGIVTARADDHGLGGNGLHGRGAMSIRHVGTVLSAVMKTFSRVSFVLTAKRCFEAGRT